MVYNTVLTAEKRGPQIVGAQIAGVYYIWDGIKQLARAVMKLNQK